MEYVAQFYERASFLYLTIDEPRSSKSHLWYLLKNHTSTLRTRLARSLILGFGYVKDSFSQRVVLGTSSRIVQPWGRVWCLLFTRTARGFPSCVSFLMSAPPARNLRCIPSLFLLRTRYPARLPAWLTPASRVSPLIRQSYRVLCHYFTSDAAARLQGHWSIAVSVSLANLPMQFRNVWKSMRKVSCEAFVLARIRSKTFTYVRVMAILPCFHICERRLSPPIWLHICVATLSHDGNHVQFLLRKLSDIASNFQLWNFIFYVDVIFSTSPYFLLFVLS